MEINKVLAYFPDLTTDQVDQLSRLKDLYEDWNAKINVISRKDMESFNERHLLHSMAIARIIAFAPGAQVLDVGTGGGFPGIPLAILFPETDFVLVDSIGKKIKVVNGVAEELGLTNVKAIHGRAEDVKMSFDFVVSRAVTQMPKFVNWVKRKFKSHSQHTLPNGILYLKGGDLTEELADFPKAELFPISDFFEEDFFETKYVVYLPAKKG
ncbi:16S rRNA (guanine(527)-N(7))-methyltransferase RsmG [Phaeocystidibacter marisrubri]|uniref:Ribosomal RNA small subunit methyltransferase G n=1 Tax=Phaeocystidibacter marisrubri TaxID=1577780 RepID=A0A6L3ZII5_9FLAO|nr:16S rRNA (guanine(527)-N(7))-methyltransferase RsmG [Phaeocystidibacter marisrubri]KAB2816990.1 16S rRNA (guanine(527)-N(7))-methyltransferase RsmG [Phaeocystidibacter marisrubri]GGH77307.1 ribosomal RNA small subunit methyltransferase G [Phaeocystidibacter marisrubri]